MIVIDQLSVQFGGVQAIRALSAKLEAPITGLVGPNGAGKTTLLNVLSGFVKRSEGTVAVDGTDLSRLPPHKRAAFGLRRTFQTEQVVENLSVADNVAALLDNIPGAARDRGALIGAALDYVGLGAKAERMGQELSAADRRMVEIARAIAGTPKLVMMDEPGAGLSQTESDRLRRVILGIPAYCGAQVLLVDHDVDLIAATCSETLVLDFGEAIACGRTETVLTDSRVRAAYLGTMPSEAG